MDFFAFDKAYVERLRDGDPDTEHHFFTYFDKLLRIRLRSRFQSSDVVEDLRQQTFIRVLEALRREGAIRHPDRFGAFVNSVCSNVMTEYYRSSMKIQESRPESQAPSPDMVLDLEGMLVTKDTHVRISRILRELPKRDRELLLAVFFEEKEKEEVCREFGVDRDYLRVLLHRAKKTFKSLYELDAHRLSTEAKPSGRGD